MVNMNASKSHRVYDSFIRGGMRPQEAEELSDLDESTLGEGEYSPYDIPALGAEISGYSETNHSLPAEDIDEYVDKLLQSPGEIVPEWSPGNGDYPFENLATTIREKRDEYTLRTVYAFEDMLEQDKAVGTVVKGEDYRHETASNSADGHLGLLLGQYISEINEIVEEESILSEAYRVIDETNEASAVAAANHPVELLPYSIQQNVFGGENISLDRINTRLRNMHGAGKCNDLERRHEKALFGEEISKLGNKPTKNNSLIKLGDELIGSLKYEGSKSMLALQDVTSNGRQVLQKGMTYRVSHPSIKEMHTDRINEDQEDYSNWEIAEPEVLEVRPLRFARAPENGSIYGFRDKIDRQVQTLRKN
jgi:hypothetical protein